MFDRDQRGANEENKETTEAQRMCQTCSAAPPNPPLADHVPQQASDGYLPIDASASSPTLFPQPDAARDPIQPDAQCSCGKTIKRRLRGSRNIAEHLSG